MARAAIYTRISLDRESDEHGVHNQREDCEALALKLGHEVVDHLSDNDAGASTRTKKKRPGYAQLLEDCRSGRIEVILAYSNSRLTRRPLELEDLITLHEVYGTTISTVVSGQDDLSTADGRMVARIKASVDAAEVERTAERVTAAHRHMAQEGKRFGHRAFGWNMDGSLRESEAIHAKGMVEAALAGMTLRSIAADLNAKGVTTARGGGWTHTTVRQYLKNPRLAGFRTRHREIVLNPSGERVWGLWEPLVDVETWEGVNGRLKGLPGRSRGAREGSYKYFLSGLCRCGTCGGVLSGNRKSDDTHSYRCSVGGHPMSIGGIQLDDMVKELLILYTSQIRVKKVDMSWPHEAELKLVGEKIASTMQAFTRGTLSESLAFGMLADLGEQRDQMTEDRTRWLGEAKGPVLSELTRQHWEEEMSPEAQRAVAGRLLEAVMIRPTVKGRVFDPERVALVWRQTPPPA